MKSSIMNLTLATAALLVASTAASAQTTQAQIPFAFVAAGHSMPAGTYYLEGSIDEAHFVLRNVAAHESVLLIAVSNHDPRREWRASNGGVLQFKCKEGCALNGVWTHKGYPAHNLATGINSERNSGRAALVQVALGRVK